MSGEQKPEASEVLIENSAGEILMLLRDDKPTIPYPNQWDFTGGVVELGETPEQAVRREAREEIGVELPNLRHLRTYDWPEKVEHVYHSLLTLNPKETNLTEGQEIRYFPKRDLLRMPLAFRDSEILNDLYGNLPDV